MNNKIYIDQYKIDIQFDNINQYEIIKNKINNNNYELNNKTNQKDINKNYFNKKYLLRDNIFENFQILFSNNENKISFIKINHSEILYEELINFINKFNSEFNILDDEEISKAFNFGILKLNSNEIFFMINSDRKFLIKINDNNIILKPININIINENESLRSYYKKLFNIIIESIDGFIKDRIKIIDNQIIINYYDAIDQFLYIIKQIILSKNLFCEEFDEKDYLNNLINFIIKDIALMQMNILKYGVECNPDHPLYNHKSLIILTYKLFNKIYYLNGNLINLSQSDITQLSDAFLYENLFEDSPPFIVNSYKKLSKAIPFRILEKIIKKQKIVEYYI